MKTINERKRALSEYIQIIKEIRLRLDIIEGALNGETKLGRVFVQEFCFLQLRMICELIAIACVSAHGDLALVSKLKRHWSADEILEKLETLDPHFFPWPSEESQDPVTKKLHIKHVADAPECVTKDELLKLYRLCGRHVHRGTYRNIFDTRRSRLVEFDEILSHCQRIVNLLAVHSVLIKRGSKVYVIHCALKDQEGNVTAFIASETDDAQPLTVKRPRMEVEEDVRLRSEAGRALGT
jgi:hypothetical protein